MTITFGSVASGATYTLPTGSEAGSPISLFTGATVTQTINNLVVSIKSGFQSGDALSSTVSAGSIVQSYNSKTGVLTLTGPDSPSNFQAMFDHIQFNTTAQSLTHRVLSYSATDGSYTSSGSFTISISGVVQQNKSYSLYASGVVPANGYVADANTVTLGQRFTFSEDGTISSIIFYNGDTPGDNFVAGLYQDSASGNTGTLMGSGAMTSTGTGWETIRLNPAIAVVSGTIYTAAYYDANAGGYAQDSNYFKSAIISGPITALASGGVFQYGASLAYPSGSYNASSYYVDVVFTPSAPPPPPPPPSSGTFTYFASGVIPTNVDVVDPNSVNLGMQFTPTTSGGITALRFYKGPTNVGVHTGDLWDYQGNNLAHVTYTSETSAGWQQQSLTTPVPLASGFVYTVSYSTSGNYAADAVYFSASGASGPFDVPQDAGVFVYASGSAWPTQAFDATNYYVDAVFSLAVTGTPVLPPPKTTGPLYFGMFGQSTAADYAATEQQFLMVPGSMWLSGPGIAYDSWSDYTGSAYSAAQLAMQQGRTKIFINIPPIINGGTLTEAAAGDFDQYYSQAAGQFNNAFFDTVVFRCIWEFQGGWYPWGWSSGQQNQSTYVQDFIGAFQHMVDAIRANMGNVPNVQFCFSGAQDDQVQMPNWQACYPGDAYVDWIGADWYDGNPGDNTGTTLADEEARWQQDNAPGAAACYTLCTTHKKGFAIPEWSVGLCGDDPYFVNQIRATLQNVQNAGLPVFAGYWRAPYGGVNGDYNLYPNTLAAMLNDFSFGQTPPASGTPTPSSWVPSGYIYQPSASDEFTAPNLDTTKWWTRYASNGGTGQNIPSNGELQLFEESNNHVMTGSSCQLTAYAPTASKNYYSSGMLRCKQAFNLQDLNTAFYFEVKAKMPVPYGSWPAFWFAAMPEPNGDAPWPPEMDVAEFMMQNPNLGARTVTTPGMSVKYNNAGINGSGTGTGPWNGWQEASSPAPSGWTWNGGSNDYWNTPVDFSAGFHVFALHYYPGTSADPVNANTGQPTHHADYYIDGVRVQDGYYDAGIGADGSSCNLELLLDYAVGGVGGLTPTPSQFPGTFEIMYVRTYLSQADSSALVADTIGQDLMPSSGG